MLNCTRHAAITSSFCGLATVGTGFAASIAKILAVYFAVAILAERYTVADLEAQIGIVGPRLDMMGVNVSGALTAMLAGMVIAGVHIYAPLFELWSKASAITIKRLAVFPSACERAYSFLACTAARTIAGASVGSGKSRAAVRTDALHWWIAMRPAYLRAVARLSLRVGAFVCNTADFTGKLYAVLSTHLRLPNHSYRAMYYTIYSEVSQLAPRYADVILRRAEAEGMECGLIESPYEAVVTP